MKSKAILFTAPNEVGLGEFELRALEPHEVLVEATYTCVSPGTELRCLRGEQGTKPRFPMIPGYAFAGRVLQAGEDADLAEGARAFCLGTRDSGPYESCWCAHLSHGIMPASEVVAVPDGVDMRAAAFSVLGAIAWHGLRLLMPVQGKRTLVVGLGVIGQLSARLFRREGAEVIACDRVQSRVDLAGAAGVKAVVPAGGDPIFPDGAEIVVDATGSVPAMNWAAKQALVPAWDPHGAYAQPVQFLVQGSYGGNVELDYDTAFNREMRLLFPRAHTYGDIRDVLDMIAAGRLQVTDLINIEATPEEAPTIYAKLADPASGAMTAVFDWSA